MHLLYQKQMNSQGQLQAEHEIVPFMASFLRDITQIAADIKASTYQLVNLDPPHSKRTIVHHNIYSIMEACHHGYEDLVRAESLLKGHLKGKISAERERDSVRESRRTARNEAALPELGGEVQFYSNRITEDEPGSHRTVLLGEKEAARRQRAERARRQMVEMRQRRQMMERIQRSEMEMEVEDLPEFMGRNQQKEMKLRESKSQGNLVTTRQVPPVRSQIHCLQPTSRQNKESVQLIKKIRDELGKGMGLSMGSSE